MLVGRFLFIDLLHDFSSRTISHNQLLNPSMCLYFYRYIVCGTSEGGGERGGGVRRSRARSYLGLHGPVHGGGLGSRAAVGEGFGGAGRQRGLLGRRGGLGGALNVLTVALVRLKGGGGGRGRKGWEDKHQMRNGG